MTKVLLSQQEMAAVDIVGDLDAMKVRSCMILFDAVSPDDIFEQVLDVFYHGTCCKKMLGPVERDVLGDARCL